MSLIVFLLSGGLINTPTNRAVTSLRSLTLLIMLLWRHLTRFLKKGRPKAESHSGSVKQTVYTQGSSKFFKMTRLELTVILLLGILGSFAFSKKPDPLANKKKVSWVTRKGSVRSHCLRSWFRKSQVFSPKYMFKQATKILLVCFGSTVIQSGNQWCSVRWLYYSKFQNNEKIHWRGFFM